MPLIAAAPGNHLDLRADRTIEVSRLPESVDAKFFDALDRSRRYAGSHAVNLITSIELRRTCEVHCVSDLIAGHVIAVLAAVYAERVLIADGAGNLSRWRDPWLKRHERGGITTEVWQQLKLL